MPGWEKREIKVDETSLTILEAGRGAPLLILHDELGPAEWQLWHQDMAQHRRLVMPVAPGFRGDRLKWMRSVTDLSRLYGRMLREQKFSPIDVVGFSFGGWLAAEIAANDPSLFRRMMLVAPFGIKPPEGHILDMYIMTTAEYLRTSVADPEAVPEFATLYNAASPETIESWEDARVESAQLGWEPYMHNPSLEHHVRGLAGLPTLIVWGSRDAIVPQSAAQSFARAIPGARLQLIEGCGHRPEIERRAEFVTMLEQFID
jgi:pimeloyl-ACP methyl ester carboxylesterase